MASRHDIIHIDFEANAGKVSPALKAIQNSAIETRKAVEKAKQALAELEKAGTDPTAIEAQRKKVNALQRDVKSLEQAEREYIKGISTLDKAIKAFNDGTLSQMSAAFQKAAYNAAKLAQTKLVPSDKDYKKSMDELNALMQRNLENMAKARMQTEDLLKAIEGGGKVSASWIRTEKQNLEELLDVIPKGTAEWNEYSAQLTKIKDYVQTLSETERRLAGEIVNADDARKMATQLTKEGAEAAAREREDAEAAIAAQKEKIAGIETERQERLKSTQALSAQVAAEANEIELKKQAITTMEEEAKAAGEVSATKKQEAEDARAAAETMKQTAKEETENLELQKKATQGAADEVTRLKGEIEKLNAAQQQSAQSTQAEANATSKLQTELEELERKLERIAKLKSESQSVVDAYEAKYGKTDDEQYEAHNKIQLEAAQRDVVAQEAAVEKVNKKWEEFWQKQEAAAQEFAQSLGKSLDEIFPEEITSEHLSGPHAKSAQAAYKVTARREYEFSEALGREGYLTERRESARYYEGDDSPEVKVIESLTRKYREYVKELKEATSADAEARRVRAELREESDAYVSAIGQLEGYREVENDLLKQKAELEKQSTSATQESVEVDKQKEELQRQLEEAEKKHADELGHLEQQQKNADKATADAAKADEEAKKKEQELAEATAETSKKLQEEQQALEGLESAHDSSVKKLQEEQQALQEYDDQIQKEAQALQEAEVKKAQSQELTVKRMEEIVAMLEKENRDTIPANSEQWKKNQQQIDELNEAIKVAKSEWMSYAEAEKFAQGIGTDGFIATSDQLQKATQSLYRYRDALIKTIQQKRDDGKATAEEEAELKKVETELKKMKFEMDNANMSSKRMHEILKDPKSAKNIEELSAAIKRSTQELKLMEETIGKDNAQYKEMAEQTKKATIEQKNMEAQFKASASAFDKAWSRLKTYVGLYVGAAVAMQKITATMGDLMELSDKMGEVRKTTGFTADEVGRLSDNLKKLDVRTSLTSLMELSSLAGSVGLKTQEDVQGFTEAANQLMIALPEMGNESARTLIKIAQATGDLQKNNNDVRETLEKVGSTIIALRANSASAAGPITDFVSRVGAVGAQAGISIDQIAALGSTIDALGGRVEMSATALSRMIPAIKNNAFGVANAIGVTEKTLTDLFNQGKAMEAMVLIFEKMRESVKQFDTTTEEGQEAMANNVEELLGKNAAMADVMKELNQQGARAGIVFGLLSQNVDELKEQLGIAGEAYRDNIALQEEFNKMNDTTAAKWERLKNQLEEMFVSDSAQRGLGWIIDKLRDIVDLLSGSSGLSVAIRSILIYLALVKVQLVSIAAGALKSLLSGLKSIGVMLGFIKGEMTALQWGNIFTAAAAAIWLAVEALGTFRHKAAEAFKEAGKWAQKIVDAEQAVESNFKAVEKANGGLDEANKKLKEAKTALEKAKKAMDGSKESADRLKKAEEDLSKAEQDVAKAEDGHRAAIDNINKIYGKYLGFTLSEVSSKKELAAAQELVNSKLREELTLKQRSAALSRVEDEMGGERDQAFGAMSQALGNVFRKKVQVKRGKGQEQTGWANDTQRNAELLRQMTKMAQEQKLSAEQIEKALSEAGVSIYETSAGSKKRISAYGASLRNVILNYSKEFHEVKEKVAEVETQFDVELSIDREKQQENLQRQYQQSEKTYAQLEQKHAKAKGDAKKKAAADLLKQADTLQDMIKNAGNFYKLDNKAEKQAYDKFISDTQKRIDGIEEQREALLKEAGELYKPQAGSSSSINTKSDKPYGTFNRVTDPYEKWDADSLVARRKEMLERVRALANGADVQKVLSEDAKFITEATRKNIKTTKDAIEWYNQERLKIQEALHARYLTNTGDWMDPKSNNGARKSAEKAAKEEMKAALDALDAYYNERDADIKEVLNSGEITEAESRRRTLKNDMEHYKRREELRRMFLKDTKNISQQEQDEIYRIIDTENVGVDQVKKEFENTVKFIDKLSTYGSSLRDGIRKNMTRDMQLQQTTVSKYQKSIDAILRKGFDSADKAYEQFKETLDTLGIMLGGSTDTMEDFLTRAQHLSEYVRDAYKYADGEELYEQMKKDSEKRLGLLEISLIQAEESERASIQARIVEERNYYNWLIQTDKDAHAQMLSQLIEYSDNYEEAIRKIAKQEERLAEQRYGKSTAGRKMDKDIKAQKDNQTTIGNRNDLATTGNIGGTGTFGQADALRAEIKLMDLEIERKKALMEIERKQAEATQAAIKIRIKAYQDEIALMDQQLAGMQESDPEYQRITADRTKANENLAGAQQQLDAAVAVSNQTMADQMKELDDLTLNRALKMQEMTKIVTDTVGEYLQELDTFAEKSGELIGSGLWGDKEERQAASKELLTEVAKTSKKLIQQWLTNLVMKQFIAQKEVQVEQATATASSAIKAGQTINDLTIEQAETTADVAAGTAKGAAKEFGSKGIFGAATAAAIGLALSLLLGMVLGKINKAKSQVAAAGGVQAGRLATGMQTYAEGNVNEFSDPNSLTPGRQYNVDGADGRTYRARYMGKDAKTHITNGPEFHLVGEKGREAIIDAKTTRQIQMNDPEIWRSIQVLYNGGSLSHTGRRGRGVRTFAAGNIDEFDTVPDGSSTGGMDMTALQASLDRNSAATEALVAELAKGIKSTVSPYGKDGIVHGYDRGKAEAKRHGLSYIP